MPPMPAMPVLPPAAVPLFRLLYLLLCFGATWALLVLHRPSPRRLRAAMVGGGVQLWLGVLLDAAGARAGLWRYAVSDGLLLGVPVDLHLGWALLWGVGFCALAPCARRDAVRCLLIWWAATVTVDGLAAPHIAALCTRGPGLLWLLMDAGLVGGLLLVSLLLCRSVERGGGRAGLRALLYLPVFTSVGLVLVPEKLLQLSGRSLWPPPSAPGPWLLLLLLCAAPGLWAVLEFARAGGTPLPFDPPPRLVVTGPYAHVRNPMQLSGVLLGLGLALLYRSWLLLGYALDLLVLSEVIFHRTEEPQLRERGGPAYAAYVKRVRRWLPRIRV